MITKILAWLYSRLHGPLASSSDSSTPQPIWAHPEPEAEEVICEHAYECPFECMGNTWHKPQDCEDGSTCQTNAHYCVLMDRDVRCRYYRTY